MSGEGRGPRERGLLRERTWRSRWGPPAPESARARFQAGEQLRRLLHILPVAAREGGAGLRELADELGVDPATILKDLDQVQDRDHYLPPGRADDIQILVESVDERVRVWTKGEFYRPAKLSLQEALCLGLGLRMARLELERPDGAAGPDAPPALDDLRRRLEEHLAAATSSPSAMDTLLRGFATPQPAAAVSGDPADSADPADPHRVLLQAATERTVCTIRYLKPGADEPGERTVRPYAVVHAEGHWYAVAWCERAEDMRNFRFDRVLAAHAGERRFEVPRDFTLADYVEIEEGRVLDVVARAARPEARATTALVRYSPVVARWIAERRDDGEWLDDGSFDVHHRVADPRWLVRHVLQYAGEAEVLEPPELRRRVREVAEGLAFSSGGT